MRPHRIEKINELLRQEVSAALNRYVKFDDGVFATVERVEASPNFSVAHVFVMVYPANRHEEVKRQIDSQIGHIQHELSAKVLMRRVPRMTMHYFGANEALEDILNKIDRKDESGAL